MNTTLIVLLPSGQWSIPITAPTSQSTKELMEALLAFTTVAIWSNGKWMKATDSGLTDL